MNIECSTEQLERQLCPLDSHNEPWGLEFEASSPFDSALGGSLDSGSSSPAGSFGSEYEDSFQRDVNYLNCYEPSSLTGMTMNFDQSSCQLSPQSMTGSPALDENDINMENLVPRSRSDSLMVPDLSQDLANNVETAFFFPTQDIEKYANDDFSLDANAQLIDECLAGDTLSANDVDEVFDALDKQEDVSSKESVEYVPDCPNITIHKMDPITDNCTEATMSQLQGGWIVVEQLSQPDPKSPGSTTISAGPSFIASSPDVSSCESENAPTPKRKGRKRKTEDEFLTPSQKKKKQNAEAARRYRQNREKETRKIEEKRNQAERELEITRRKFMKKMGERNIMLKLIHDSWKDPRSNLRNKYNIVFPPWIHQWIKSESESD